MIVTLALILSAPLRPRSFAGVMCAAQQTKPIRAVGGSDPMPV